jgi:hypothetical protein
MILHLTATPEGILLIDKCLSIIQDIRHHGICEATAIEANRINESELQTATAQIEKLITANNLSHAKH